MRALPSAALAATLLLAGAAGAQETPFEPTGEVRLFGAGVGTGASFDETRIVGPNVNLTRREDGTWGGDLGGQNVDLHREGDNRLTGPNVNITYSTSKDGTTRVEGLFYGRRVRVEMGKKKLSGRLGACSLDLSRRNVQTFFGDVGCSSPQLGLGTSGKATLTLLGEAASQSPPLPQFAIALFALLPG